MNWNLANLVLALAPPTGSGSGQPGAPWYIQLFPFFLLIFVFYFLLIRPQQKKAKEHKALLESMKKGDNVITAGGVHGKITSVDNEIVTLEVANNVNIKITKSYIAAIKKD